MSNAFAGTWTYRSFLNNPAFVGNDPAKLQAQFFAEGVWTIRQCHGLEGRYHPGA
jgi:hypothetical protein